MSIIVEGPDGGGKTTLISKISEVFHLDPEPRVVDQQTRAMTNLKVWVEEDNKRPEGWILYDRHRLISECIYGPIMRPQGRDGFTNYSWLADQLGIFYSRQPFIIYCLPPAEEVKRNVYGDSNNGAVMPYIDVIYDAYVVRAAIDRYHTPTHHWDYTNPSEDMLLDSLDYYLKNGM